MVPYSDADAIRRSLAEPWRFESIFDRHFVAVYRYICHCLDERAAEDLAAETFVRAFAARDRYVASRPSARAWLFAIATNLARDEHRRRARVDGLAQRLSQSPSTDEVVVDCPDDGLRAAMMELPDVEREALVLFAWAELSYEEIAEATNTPIGTVRSRLNRARGRLRVTLCVPAISDGGC